jgi:hypothetical protein
MITQNYLIIESNIVTNVCVWDGDVSTWAPPADSILLIQATTPAMVWDLDTTTDPSSFVLKEHIGVGNIGFTWDGTILTTNQPQPQLPTPSANQPNSSGLLKA